MEFTKGPTPYHILSGEQESESEISWLEMDEGRHDMISPNGSPMQLVVSPTLTFQVLKDWKQWVETDKMQELDLIGFLVL